MPIVSLWLLSLDTLRIKGRRINVSVQATFRLADAEKADARIIALAQIDSEEIVPYHNLLPLDAGGKVQLRFWQTMLGQQLSGAAYLIRVRETFALREAFDLTRTSLRKMRGFLVTLDEPNGTLATKLLVNEADLGEVTPACALRVPLPHIRQITDGVWKTLLLPHVPATEVGGTSALILDWDRAGIAAPAFPHYAYAALKENLVLDQPVLEAVLDMLKENVSALDPQDEFKSVEFQKWQRVATILEDTHDALDETSLARCARDMFGTAGLLVDGSRGARRQYQAAYLVKALVLANTLRNSASLRSAVEKAVRMVLPPVLLKPFQAIIAASEQHFPHPSTISRWRTLLDGAYMLYQRKCNAEPQKSRNCVRYLLADASVQHRRDFEHIMVAQIDCSQLPELWRLAAELLRLWFPGHSRKMNA